MNSRNGDDSVSFLYSYVTNYTQTQWLKTTTISLYLTLLRVGNWSKAQLGDFSASRGIECGSYVTSASGRAGPRQSYSLSGCFGRGGWKTWLSWALPLSIDSQGFSTWSLLQSGETSQQTKLPASYGPVLDLIYHHHPILHCSKQPEATPDSREGEIDAHLSLRGSVKEYVAAFTPPESVNKITLYICFRICTLDLEPGQNRSCLHSVFLKVLSTCSLCAQALCYLLRET